MSLLPFNGSWAKSRLIWFAGGPEASRGEGEPQPQSRRGDAEQSPAESEAELASRRDVTPPRQSREQQLSLDEQHERLILGLHHLGERAEVLRQSYLRANNEATALIPDFSALNKLDPVNDLRWVNGALMEIQKIPVGDQTVDFAMPDVTLTRLRGQIAKAQTLFQRNSTSSGIEKNGQMNTLRRLGEKAEVLRQSYLRANNEATALIPDFSALNKLDPVNDLRWVNGVIEELNQIPSGNPQIDLVVPDRTVGQLRSLILRARTLINDKASPAGAEE